MAVVIGADVQVSGSSVSCSPSNYPASRPVVFVVDGAQVSHRAWRQWLRSRSVAAVVNATPVATDDMVAVERLAPAVHDLDAVGWWLTSPATIAARGGSVTVGDPNWRDLGEF